MTVSATDVKALRDRTGAGLMDCKAALAEAEGDIDRAIEILRIKGQASAAKRAGRGTDQGVVASYIHVNDQVGTMVEVQCETDFVARSDEFKEFANEIAQHIAGTGARYVSADDIPDDERENERRVLEEEAREEGLPADKIEQIVEGRLAKGLKEIVLLEQQHINVDKHDGKTIEEMRQDVTQKTKENVRIARFAYYRVGEE
jgi:elongation factor Ts